METKSRYEVIAELETKKRSLILERDGLNDQLLQKQKVVKDLQRRKDDNIVVLNRQIDDAEEEVNNFSKTLTERKETISELIKSVDDSLERFNKISKDKS